MSLRDALIVAVAACSIGLWEALPFIVGRLVARADQPGAHVGLLRLKVGHAMAGGGKGADVLIADSIKAVGMAKLWGPARTASRESWRSFAGALSAAERSYVAPGKGFGLGPPEHANAEVAEGIRYVSHITRLALELRCEQVLPAPRPWSH